MRDERFVDITFHRTGKAAEFLLYNHVILRTAHSLGERAVFKSMFFRCSEQKCRLSAVRPVQRPVHRST